MCAKVEMTSAAAADGAPVINYVTSLRNKHHTNFKSITHKKLDISSLEKLGSDYIHERITPDQGYFRLFADIDEIHTIVELEGCFENIKQIAKALNVKSVSVAGYTNDKNVADTYGFKLQPSSKKYVSLHVCFYTIKISKDDYKKLVDDKYNCKVNIIDDKHTDIGLLTCVDKAIYSFVKDDSLQLMRIPISYKEDSKHNFAKVDTRCNIIDIVDYDEEEECYVGLPTSTNVITCNGDERLVTLDELAEAGLYEETTSEQIEPTTTKQPVDRNQEDYNAILEAEGVVAPCDMITPEDIERISSNKPPKKLFETLIEGLKDKSVTIHCTCTDKVDKEIAISMLYVTAYWCVEDNEEFENYDIYDEFQDISHKATLTANCQANFMKTICNALTDYHNGKLKINNCGYLFNAIKFHNKQYYNDHVVPLIRASMQPNAENEFKNTSYNLTDFDADRLAGKFKDEKDYITHLTKVLAFINDGRYIIKEVNNDFKIDFNIIDEKKLKSKLKFDIPVNVKLNADEKAKLIKQNKDVTEYKVVKVDVLKHLRSNNVEAQFKHYACTDMFDGKVIRDDRTYDCFGEFVPPTPNACLNPITYKPELITQWRLLVDEHLFDEEAIRAFEHLLNINAYLLQHHQKAAVFFVMFSVEGDTGKNWFANTFQKLYGKLALLGITEKQLDEKHNGGLSGKAYRHYDELSPDNYKSGAAESIIKRLTNRYAAVRKMNTDTEQAKDYAIDVLNTNEPDLYGMLNGDDQKKKALRSRLCIIRLKEQSLKKEPHAQYIDVIDDPSFAYTFYRHLMERNITEFVANKSYNRYDSSKVQEQLKAMKTNVLDDFVKNLDITWKDHKFRGDATEYECCSAKDLREAYTEYMKGYRNKLTFVNLEKELAKSYGITRVEGKGVKMNGISPVAAFKRVKVTEDVEDENDEDTIVRYNDEIRELEAKLKAKQEKLQKLMKKVNKQ